MDDIYHLSPDLLATIDTPKPWRTYCGLSGASDPEYQNSVTDDNVRFIDGIHGTPRLLQAAL